MTTSALLRRVERLAHSTAITTRSLDPAAERAYNSLGAFATEMLGVIPAHHHRLLIEKLEAAGRLDALPPALREMARWRLANPELNLGELARRMKLSKSAVNHRLRRLQQVAGHSAGGASPNPARRSA